MGSDILRSILERVQGGVEDDPVVIFDLDSTLFSTRERSFFILTEAAKVYPALAPVLAKLHPRKMRWRFIEDIREAGLADDDLLQKIERFWMERFFTSAYLVHDRPMPGAVEYVRAVHDAGARICYLTGRDFPNMSRGTIDSLRRYGFAYGEAGVELIMKANFEQLDEEHKRDSMARVRALGHVVAAFDNEPELVNLFVDSFPDATVVLFDSMHSPTKVSPYASVRKIGAFEIGAG